MYCYVYAKKKLFIINHFSVGTNNNNKKLHPTPTPHTNWLHSPAVSLNTKKKHQKNIK